MIALKQIGVIRTDFPEKFGIMDFYLKECACLLYTSDAADE